MSTIAAWKDRYFGVSPEYTATISDFTYAWEQEADKTESADDKTKQTVEKGLKPFYINMTANYVYPYSGDVRACHTSWSEYIGQVDYFYTVDDAGTPYAFGPMVQLQKAELKDLVTDDLGRWLKASTVLSFKEYDAEKSAIKVDTSTIPTPGTNTKQDMKRVLNTHLQGAVFTDKVTFQVGSQVKITGSKNASGNALSSGLQGSRGTVKEIDNSGIRMLVTTPDGRETWINTMDMSLEG